MWIEVLRGEVGGEAGCERDGFYVSDDAEGEKEVEKEGENTKSVLGTKTCLFLVHDEMVNC